MPNSDPEFGPFSGSENGAWPRGWRSAPVEWRALGLLRPLLAILVAVGAPAVVANLALMVTGLSFDTASGAAILLVLYAFLFAPVPAFFLLPLLWPVVLAAAARGWAGLCSAIAIANGIGIPVVHVILHADLTTEAPWALPSMSVALSAQAALGWAVLWALIDHTRKKAATIRPDAARNAASTR